MFLAIAIALLLFPSLLDAHQEGPGSHVVRAHRIGAAPPRIDGRLDDPVWLAAEPVSGFLQLEPERGAPATDDTRFHVAYDEHNLYVAFRCYDARPELIVNRLARREQVFLSDLISFYIDPHHDHRTGYSFVATPGGVQQDSYRYDDSGRDPSWRGIWWAEGRIDEEGWAVEFKIPFANFRFDVAAAATWGFDVERINMRKSEVTVWKQMTQAGRLTRMSDLGHLTELISIGGGKAYEVTPYVLAGGSKTHGRSTGERGAVGLDMQYNVTQALKANLTVNPDFAQVEADQLEINLTRFPTRFAEQRPFFVEGNSFFETPFDLFFSRRIGSRGDILWGSKMSGKVGPYSVGFLASQTGGADLLEAGRRREMKEEATYGVLRVKKDVLRRSNVGFLVGTEETEEAHGRVAGVDASLAIGSMYALTGQYAASFAPGEDQRNRALEIELSQRNYLWDAAVEVERVEPGFETNRTGFLNKEPFRGWQGIDVDGSYSPRWGRHRFSLGGALALEQGLYRDQYFDAWLAAEQGRRLDSEFAEDLLAWVLEADASVEFTESFWDYARVAFSRSRQIELADVFEANNLGFGLRTNGSRALSGRLQADAGDFFNFVTQSRGSRRQIRLDGTLRPQSNLAFELSTSYAQSLDRSDEADGRFFVGSLRTTYLFTRDTFVRLFAQSERQRTDYGRRETRRGYLVSALFGWEYSPKSNLFLAYNEDWSGPQGDLNLEDRVVVLKVSYLSNF